MRLLPPEYLVDRRRLGPVRVVKRLSQSPFPFPLPDAEDIQGAKPGTVPPRATFLRREPNIMRMRGPVKIYRGIPLAVGLVLSQVAVAAPPDSRDPALTPWFESLKQPGTGAPCCSIADCRTVESRQDRDGYEVLIDGRWKMSVPFWLHVPPDRIIDGIDNPTGRGVVCFTPEAGILCFVPPPES